MDFTPRNPIFLFSPVPSPHRSLLYASFDCSFLVLASDRGDAEEEFDARAWYEKYSKEVVEGRNLDKAISDYWTENVVYHNIDKTQGGAAVKAALTPYYDAFTDVKITIDDVIYQGNTVAARVTFEGKHTGKVGDIAPTGATVKQQITNWYVLKEGKISDIWSLADSAQVLSAIGAKAAPAPAAEASGSGAGSGSGAAAPAAPTEKK